MRNKIVFGFAFFVILSLSSACFAQVAQNVQEKNDDVKISLTHGPGGSVRRNETFFTGEAAVLSLELPSKVIKDGKYELQIKTELYSKKQPGKTVQPVQAVPSRGVVWQNAPIRILCGLSIPKECDPGDYEIRVTVSDSLNLSFLIGSTSIKVKKSNEFGIRSLVCLHHIPGSEHWAFGSNYFSVGEHARIVFTFGGLTPAEPKNEQPGFEAVNFGKEIASELSFEIIDETGKNVDPFKNVPEDNPILKNFGDENSIGNYQLTVPFSQAGNYIVRVSLKDLNSDKTDIQEIPVFVLPFNPPVKKPEKSSE